MNTMDYYDNEYAIRSMCNTLKNRILGSAENCNLYYNLFNRHAYETYDNCKQVVVMNKSSDYQEYWKVTYAIPIKLEFCI